MDLRLAALNEIVKLNDRLFCNCLKGVPDELARQRPNAATSSVAFLACHLVDARDCLAKLLGIEVRNHVHNGLQNYAAAVDIQHEPPLTEVLAAWKAVTNLVSERLPEMTTQDLDRTSEEIFPTEDRTLFGALVFLLHHESYHIGQMAIVRKYFGAGAIRYGHRALLAQD